MKATSWYFRSSSLAVGLFLSFCQTGIAQDPALECKTPESAACNYDPISAMLDSLVTLNYVERLNFASAAPGSNFQPHEVPSYSDEVYTSRISKIQSPIPLNFNQQVKEYIDLYALKKRGLTERVMGLAQLYFPMYEQVLDQNDLPLEFKYLSIVESALNPMAKSRVGATGLWQFMLQTGKMYNLKVNSYIDERRDPLKSTQAACDYFKNMYRIYNDWLLVIAAYNCGAGNVNKAIARSGGKMNFWEISPYLPRETRGYVPAFIAVTYLMNYAADHNLTAVPPVINFHEADTVMVDHQVSLRDISDVIDVPYDLLTYLNPVYKRGIIPESDEPQALRLPTNKINTYLASLDKIFVPGNMPTYTANAADVTPLNDYVTRTVKKYHIVKNGEHLYSIADKYNCSITDLKRWNKFRGTKVYKGQRLLVYVPGKAKVAGQADATPAKENSAVKTTAKISAKTSTNGKYIWHVVQKGDTLYGIAKRYGGLTIEDIKELNNLESNSLKPGTRLKLKVNVG